MSVCWITKAPFPHCWHSNIRGPFYLHVSSLKPAGISNHMPSKLWDEITYPSPNFNGAVKVWEWKNNFTLYKGCKMVKWVPDDILAPWQMYSRNFTTIFEDFNAKSRLSGAWMSDYMSQNVIIYPSKETCLFTQFILSTHSQIYSPSTFLVNKIPFAIGKY